MAQRYLSIISPFLVPLKSPSYPVLSCSIPMSLVTIRWYHQLNPNQITFSTVLQECPHLWQLYPQSSHEQYMIDWIHGQEKEKRPRKIAPCQHLRGQLEVLIALGLYVWSSCQTTAKQRVQELQIHTGALRMLSISRIQMWVHSFKGFG